MTEVYKGFKFKIKKSIYKKKYQLVWHFPCNTEI